MLFFDRCLYAVSLLRGLRVKRRLDCNPKRTSVVGKCKIIKSNAKITAGDYLRIYPNVKISCCGDSLQSPARLSLGDHVAIGDNTEIHCGSNIEIGTGTLISWNVCIIDRDYHKFNAPVENKAPITIGDNVWIGCNCIILKGVKIGSGAVIGAGTVVVDDVPAHSLCVGNPGKIVKTDISWER